MSQLRDDDPEGIGWYATLQCWDAEEGTFPGAHFWNGSDWEPDTSASVQYWPIVFKSEVLAADYAYEHDPEGDY